MYGPNKKVSYTLERVSQDLKRRNTYGIVYTYKLEISSDKTLVFAVKFDSSIEPYEGTNETTCLQEYF